MSDAASDARPAATPHSTKKLRLWPGVTLAVLQLLVSFVLPLFLPDQRILAVLGAAATGFLILLWWLLFSRAPWGERFAALGLMALVVYLFKLFIHPSIGGAGMGYLYPMMAIPAMCLMLVAAVAMGRAQNSKTRLALIAAAFVVAGTFFTMIRTGGFDAAGQSDYAWRWTPTPEDKLLATADAPKGSPAVALAGDAEWPGFRGPQRDGVMPASAIGQNWASSPPVEVWRRPVGPGWSSFAVHGDLIYTQEQRGEDEVVSCYDARTGEPVWQHRDRARFYESNGGAGPRGTPTLAGDRVYTFGGTGIVNALDAATGALIWTRQAATEAGTKIPTWGYSSSPLVVDDLVIVASSGRLMAYDAATGAPRWQGPAAKASYSSPHLVTLDGVRQVLQLDAVGLIGVSPADGKVLWNHAWTGYPIVQPALTPEGDVLISVSDSSGLRRLAIHQQDGAWKVEEQWTSTGLKPYFSDFALHRGHAYGFDGGILSCIDLADGKRKWKGGRYGQGQLILLPAQDLLLILGEHGELALVKALPDQFTEVAQMPAITGKTWNHPVLVSDLLLVRNAEEMAAFRLRG